MAVLMRRLLDRVTSAAEWAQLRGPEPCIGGTGRGNYFHPPLTQPPPSTPIPRPPASRPPLACPPLACPSGAERLRKQVVIAARDNDALRPDSPVRLLLAAVGRVRPQPHLLRSVAQAIDEDNNIQVRRVAVVARWGDGAGW